MKIFIVCSDEFMEMPGCYVDSVWSKEKKARKRREELNESPDYSYDQPWHVEERKLDQAGGY